MATTTMELLDCGHYPGAHEACTTGYGRDAEGLTYCYDCCAQRELTSMLTTGKATLYLTLKDGKHTMTDWPGHLSFPVMEFRKGKHNMARVRYDVYFRVPSNGSTWHGVKYGDMTQLVHCRQLKG